jgi:hypothetical protein
MKTFQSVVCSHSCVVDFQQGEHDQGILECLFQPLHQLRKSASPAFHQLPSSVPCSLRIRSIEDISQSGMDFFSSFHGYLACCVSLIVCLAALPGYLREILSHRFAKPLCSSEVMYFTSLASSPHSSRSEKASFQVASSSVGATTTLRISR